MKMIYSHNQIMIMSTDTVEKLIVTSLDDNLRWVNQKNDDALFLKRFYLSNT